MIARELLLRRVREVRKRAGDIARAGATLHEGPLSCTAGCSYCCHQKLVGAAFEGVGIYLYLKARGAWTPELRQRLVDADLYQTARTHLGHLMARRPCVFLDEESFGSGSCTIYPVRPSACATTFSIGDPERCADPVGHATFAVQNDEINRLSLANDREMIGAFGDGALDFVTLAAAVLLAEARFEDLPRPDVHVVPIEGHTAGTLTEAFDRCATIKER